MLTTGLRWAPDTAPINRMTANTVKAGAHLNPVVSIAFALRRDFQWRRVPGYVLAQLLGALLAAWVLRLTFGDVAHLGSTLPGSGFTATQAFVIEVLLTLGLVSTILGTASSAQNLGPLSPDPPMIFVD